jgi:hypothetical protein
MASYKTPKWKDETTQNTNHKVGIPNKPMDYTTKNLPQKTNAKS